MISDKSFDFAVKIFNLYRRLSEEKKEYVISRQLLRSGTSIGANIAEAEESQSRLDFVSKLSIALKEASETEYWLKLLSATGYLDSADYELIIGDCIEIKKILVTIIKKTKENHSK